MESINQSIWTYVRISLYKPFLLGFVDIRMHVSTTVVRMDEFM